MEWITKRHAVNSEADVTITKAKNEIRYSVRFRNKSYASITPTKKIMYAFVGSRIYFKQGDEKSGFTLTNFSDDKRIAAVQITLCKDDFLGDYPLQYDGKEKLYYIDINNKIK